MNRTQLYTLAGALLASTALSSVTGVISEARAQVAQQFVNAQTGTTYTILQTDCSKLVTLSNAAAVAVTLPQAGTAGKFFGGCFFDIENKGVGRVTITPTTSTINGASTLVLGTNQGARVTSDGTNYQVQFGAGTSGGTAACAATGNSPQTCSGLRGTVTTGTLTTAAQAAGVAATIATFTVTNTSVTTLSVVVCFNEGYSGTLGTNGIPLIVTCAPGNGNIAVQITNAAVTFALNGTVAIGFIVSN